MFILAVIGGRAGWNEEDLRFLANITARDQRAFGQFYDRYASVVYTLLLRIVGSSAEAEDILQEIFLQIWNKSASFSETKGSVYTWVMTIARHKAIDHLRSKESTRRKATVDTESATVLPDATYLASPLQAAISSECEALMKQALESLTDDRRTIIELSYYDGYTQEQIAGRLKLPLGTVKTRMRQGMMMLRTFLKERLQS